MFLKVKKRTWTANTLWVQQTPPSPPFKKKSRRFQVKEIHLETRLGLSLYRQLKSNERIPGNCGNSRNRKMVMQ